MARPERPLIQVFMPHEYIQGMTGKEIKALDLTAFQVRRKNPYEEIQTGEWTPLPVESAVVNWLRHRAKDADILVIETLAAMPIYDHEDPPFWEIRKAGTAGEGTS